MGENETRFLSLSGQGFQLIRGTVMAEKKEFIRIRGARENNLKALNVDIPRNQFVVFTGLSGSGKSSLAFDTIYAEGQRRYMESLSSYARQFLGQMEKPNVDSIEGLPPAISIDQKSTNRNPRSTVGTVTEIYDYFRLLYARIGIPHCPKCGKVISRQSVDQMVDQIMALPERTKIQLLAPVVRGRKGRHEKVLEQAKRSGYVRVMIDGSQYELSEEITLDKNLKHNISIIVDRLVVKPDIEKRLTDSVENVLDLADGLVRLGGRVLVLEDDVHVGGLVVLVIVVVDVVVVDEFTRTVDVGCHVGPHDHVHTLNICDAVLDVFRFVKRHVMEHYAAHAGIGELVLHDVERLRGRGGVGKVLGQVVVDADHRDADEADHDEYGKYLFDQFSVVND